VNQLQGNIDMARREAHLAGVRPYRVFMVWQQRDRHQVYQDVRRLELMPVLISDASPIHGVSWSTTVNARRREGDLLLTNISANQVVGSELLGHHQGEEIPADWQFFYEVVRMPTCPTDTGIRSQRYTPAGLPERTATEWIVRVSVQDNSAHADGTDATHDRTKPGTSAYDKLRR
jgi:hypothetical protein